MGLDENAIVPLEE